MKIFAGNSITVTKGTKLLTVEASIHTDFKTKTKGLLGNFDLKDDNDYIFPNGTSLKSNPSEEDVFYYGQTCKFA